MTREIRAISYKESRIEHFKALRERRRRKENSHAEIY